MSTTRTKLVERVKYLTDINNHTGALIEIAKWGGEVAVRDELEGIERAHQRAGHLTIYLKQRRDQCREDLRGFIISIAGKLIWDQCRV